MASVRKLLEVLGLAQYISVFEANDIDCTALDHLTEAEWDKLGVTLDHRKKLRNAVSTAPEIGWPAAQLPTSDHYSEGIEIHEPERRQLTIVFCDLVDSTQMSQQLDPEELQDILRTYRTACLTAVERYEGQIVRYMGDGVLVFFGYPVAHEDDAERALHASLKIIQNLARVNSDFEDGWGIKLDARIGIATGSVVVGDLIGAGSSQLVDVVGETPNLAARLQSLADKNTILISGTTRDLVKHDFNLHRLGKRKIRGLEKKQAVWRVLGPTLSEGRFKARLASRLTPMVGRRRETELLLNGWQLAKEGKGNAFFVDGEAGVGKSRLIQSFREHIDNEPHKVLFYQCSPLHSNTPFFPVIHHIENALKFEPNDDPDKKIDKLISFLEATGSNQNRNVALFSSLLSIPFEHRFDKMNLTPKRLKEQTFEALMGMVLNLAMREPILIVFEDVHWIDPTSMEILEQFAEQLQRAKILLIITSRPEFAFPWPRQPNLSVLHLRRLADKHCGRMLDNIKWNNRIERSQRREIIDKADGIPLYVEELAKSAIELNETLYPASLGGGQSIEPMLGVPSSLQASLIARLDRLGTAKRLAQIGSAIGREFAGPLIAEVAKIPLDELTLALRRLVDSGLVFARGRPPKITYQFNHALVRDVAYESLLRSRRPGLHLRIAEALEKDSSPVVSPELLGYHYSRAGSPEKAVRYFGLAGKLAIDRSANVEAHTNLTQALKLLRELPDDTARKEEELSLLVSLGPVEIAIQGSGSNDAQKLYDRAIELCNQLPNSLHHFAAYWGQWRTSKTYSIKRERADRLLPIAESLGDAGLCLQAHHCQWASLYNLGQHVKCCGHVEEGLQIYYDGDYRSHALVYGGHDPAICGHGEAALSFWILGRPERALEEIKKALVLAGELSHAGSKLHAMDIALMLHYFRQDANEVYARANEMITFGEVEEFAVHQVKGQIFRGWAQIQLADVDRGIRNVEDGINAMREMGTDEDMPVFLAMLSSCYALIEEYDMALVQLEAAIEHASQTSCVYWIPEIYRLKGEVSMRAKAGQEEKAWQSFTKSLEIARSQSARALESRALISMGKLNGRKIA